MIRLGLTGGIGMGKSTVAALFAAQGVPTFNADEAVHQLQAPGGGAMAALEAAFPELVTEGILNRSGLRALVLEDPTQMRRLEQIMHPLVRQARADFLARMQDKKAVLFDIPLLFETGGQAECDKTIVVSCPRDVQIDRVRQRGLPLEDIEALIERQLPDAKKRALADYVIENGGILASTTMQVQAIIQELGL